MVRFDVDDIETWQAHPKEVIDDGDFGVRGRDLVPHHNDVLLRGQIK